MAFGRYRAAHHGIPTTTCQREDDFRTFCQRQAARADAIARRSLRRYVDRLVKLSTEGASAGDGRLEYRRAGYTYGGIETESRRDRKKATGADETD